MSIGPGDIFMQYTPFGHILWIMLEVRDNGSWSIYCPARNKMSYEWKQHLENPELWRKLA